MTWGSWKGTTLVILFEPLKESMPEAKTTPDSCDNFYLLLKEQTIKSPWNNSNTRRQQDASTLNEGVAELPKSKGRGSILGKNDPVLPKPRLPPQQKWEIPK